jgi:hypothetical protein
VCAAKVDKNTVTRRLYSVTWKLSTLLIGILTNTSMIGILEELGIAADHLKWRNATKGVGMAYQTQNFYDVECPPRTRF